MYDYYIAMGLTPEQATIANSHLTTDKNTYGEGRFAKQPRLSNNIVVGVDMMDEFIDKAFELGDMEGLSKDDLKNYIRFRANTKLQDLGLKTNWKAVKKESIENMMWFDILSNGVEMQDFFAGRVSSYSKGTIDWSKMYE